MSKIEVGSAVFIEKGCPSLGIIKGRIFAVTAVEPMGAEFNHMVKVSLREANSVKSITLWARHPNRLSDDTTTLNNGNPLKKVVISGL